MLFAKVAILLIGLTQLSYGLPDGADPLACGNMIPQHDGSTPPPAPHPFTITTSLSSITPGQQLQLVITRTNTDNFIRGFMCLGRTAAGLPTGQFITTAGMRLMPCPPAGSSATHSVSENRASMSLTWVPSPGFTGTVTFFCTVVHDFGRFFPNMGSAPVTVS